MKAAEYQVGSQADITNQIAAINSDPNAVIVLTNSFTLTGPMPAITQPLTIRTNGFSISAPDGNNPGINLFNNNFTGGSLTIIGNGAVGEGLFGGDAAGAANTPGGMGLSLSNVTVTNDGAITGGFNRQRYDGPVGFGLQTGGTGLHLVNGRLINNVNGVITGGAGGSRGVLLDGGRFHENHGIIQSSQTAGSPALEMRDATLTNSGEILGGPVAAVFMWGESTLINDEDGLIDGGEGTLGRGGDAFNVRDGSHRIVNYGTIRGGAGTRTFRPMAILASQGGTLEIINGGRIEYGTGGTGGPLAIASGAGIFAKRIILELHAGSEIIGNVGASRTFNNDVLRLGGDEDSAFDVSKIKAAPVSDPFSYTAADDEYLNFNIFEKTGASTWNITGVQTGVTPWDIYAGNFQVAEGANTGPGTVDLIGGILSGSGTVGATNAAANTIISPGVEGIDRRDVLTINGAYSGNNNFLDIQTVLGDDNSDTDLLRINGGTVAGVTFVRVTNDGGGGAQTNNGIRIVDVEGGASDGDFELLGDLVLNGQQAVLGGAFAYSLFQGTPTTDDGDWYLRSIGFTPSATAYESYPGVLLGLIDMPTMQQRVGNVYMPNAGSTTDSYVNPEPVADAMEAVPTPPPANFWTRFEAAYGHHEGDSDSGTEYDLDRYKIQVGIDGRLGESEDGILMAGINAQYGHADADLESDTGDGDNSTDSFGGGLTLTWVSASGFYADAQGQVHYLEGDLSSDVFGDLVENNEGWGYGLSLELGRKLALDDVISLTPQAQLAYTSVDFDDFTDDQGVDVELDEGESLKGRLGLALGVDSYDAGDSRSHFYAIANVTYEFLDAQSVDIAGVDVEFEPEEFGGELGLGGTYEWAGGAYSLHGEALGQTSFEGSYGVKGTAGFSARF